jgi:Protein of unknown function (DUF2442)
VDTLARAADERVVQVSFSEDEMSVRLMDGRTITVPLAWYPRLLNATPEQRNQWRIAGGGYGIHWPDVDEDLSTEGLLRGAPASGAPSDSSSLRIKGSSLHGFATKRSKTKKSD